MEIVMQHNFFPSLLMLGGAIACFHYNSFTSVDCPIIVAEGESQTGKSTTIKIAMSLFGMGSSLRVVIDA